MSGTAADRKRLLRITAGNLRNNHIYIGSHFDFFPDDCIGSSDAESLGVPIQILLTGLNKSIKTDIGSDSRTGKPRGHFRRRAWVRQFFEHHNIQTGDVLALERIADRRYRLYPFDAKAERNGDWKERLAEPLPGDGPTVLELFAGCD